MQQLKFEPWEIKLAVVVLLIAGIFILGRINFEDLVTINPRKPVHMEGKIAATSTLKKVELLSIPNEVYEAIKNEPIPPKGKQYFFGNKKYVIVIYDDEKFRIPSYRSALKNLFENEDFSEYYHKRLIYNDGFFCIMGDCSLYWVNLFVSRCTVCRSEYCPMHWLYRNCAGRTCIINPARREAVVDSSQDERQLPIVLEKYKNW